MKLLAKKLKEEIKEEADGGITPQIKSGQGKVSGNVV